MPTDKFTVSVPFQFPNGFSQSDYNQFHMPTIVNFQFPNGFSLEKPEKKPEKKPEYLSIP